MAAEELRAWLKGRLASFKVPAHWKVRAAECSLLSQEARLEAAPPACEPATPPGCAPAACGLRPAPPHPFAQPLSKGSASPPPLCPPFPCACSLWAPPLPASPVKACPPPTHPLASTLPAPPMRSWLTPPLVASPVKACPPPTPLPSLLLVVHAAPPPLQYAAGGRLPRHRLRQAPEVQDGPAGGARAGPGARAGGLRPPCRAASHAAAAAAGRAASAPWPADRTAAISGERKRAQPLTLE